MDRSIRQSATEEEKSTPTPDSVAGAIARASLHVTEPDLDPFEFWSAVQDCAHDALRAAIREEVA